MTCSANFHDANAGLIMESWSGSSKVNNKPQLICTVDDNNKSSHFVEVKNRKTYDREVYVKGIIPSTNNKAKFEGYSVNNEREWEESHTLYHNQRSQTHVHLFGGIAITKKAVGTETIKISVEYEDHWNLGKRWVANAQTVVFKTAVA